MSRLDRLVLLLDTGTSVVRNTAAEQLAQVQKAHPHELHNLLGRVVPYLKSNQWETRAAAAKAIGGIVEYVSVFDPNASEECIAADDSGEHAQDDGTLPSDSGSVPLSTDGDALLAYERKAVVESDMGNSFVEKNSTEDEFTFETFDIISVIKNGRPLLGSAGKEYDWIAADLSPEERLARAKLSVTSRLGLGAEYMEKDFLSTQDLSATPTGPHSSNSTPQHTSLAASGPIESLNADSDAPLPAEALSARQRNMKKRKAKIGNKSTPNKVRVVDVSGISADRRESQDGHPSALSTASIPDSSGNDYFSITPQTHNVDRIVVEHKVPSQSPSTLLASAGQADTWPLNGLVELLVVDIFDPQWECRHGAALALREVLRIHAPGAGRRLGKSRMRNALANKNYLDDLACRLCCIFALDRFGDYVSDQVIAPIRETVSQTLAALLKHLAESSVKATFKVLTTLIFQSGLPVKAWEITHGGMLGMKYLVAIRTDILIDSPELLDGIVESVLYGLANHDDDVRAVGAATMIPIVSEFVQNRPQSVGKLLDVLWDCLAELRDDLSASTGSVMDLLAKLCSMPTVLQIMQRKSEFEEDHSFAMLIPRLYPFLRHTITSVRRAVLRALSTFLTADPSAFKTWIDSRLLRLLFQNLLVEQNLEVLHASSDLWNQCLESVPEDSETSLFKMYAPWLESHLSLVMTPIGYGRHSAPLDTAFFIRPTGQTYASSPSNNKAESISSLPPKTGRKKKDSSKEEPKFTHNTDSPMLRGDLELVSFDTVLQTRVAASVALGRMLSYWPEVNGKASITKLFAEFSQSSASSPRLLSATIVQEFVAASVKAPGTFAEVREMLERSAMQELPRSYANLSSLIRTVRGQCQALCNIFSENGRVPFNKLPVLAVICAGDSDAGPTAFGISSAEKLIGEDFDRLQRTMSSSFKGPVAKMLEDARQSVSKAIDTAVDAKAGEDVRISASRGAALVATGELPKKLNPVLKALMDSIKKEENAFLQGRSANALASLVALCSSSNRSTAAEKLIRNLCAFLCVDTSETPEFHRNIRMTDAIYSLRREEVPAVQHDEKYLREIREARTKHLGAQMALEEMAIRFGSNLFTIIPNLNECIFSPLRRVFGQNQDGTAKVSLKDANTLGQEVIDGLCVLRALVGKFDPDLFQTVIDCVPDLLMALQSEYSTIRHAAASCFAHICKANPIQGIHIAVEKVIPMLSDATDIRKRQGAMEAINFLVISMDIDILPYVIFLIVPVLGRMSDSDNDIRIVATTTFAILVKLVPLEAGIPDPPGFSAELLKSRDEERQFIQQMLDGSKVDRFEIPVSIKADLRSYQQEGVNWLAFLNKYQLHGILCDDMGLGKTLQTICIVASDHHNRNIKFKESALGDFRPLPSLIICPPSLSGHWQHEFATYAPFLNCVSYVGYPPERKLQRAHLQTADVIITSYDIARNDVDFLSKKAFNYCVLDEGHIIKNSKAKLTQSVKLLSANHRLILSGTPIQNNVLELWSLFDFLMPGFLGTEKSFHERYAKPIANSRDSKSSSKEQEAGALALEALHKQVLPFLLRRLKEEVLADLPPKIIQDYYCDLSPLQKALYNDFASSQAPIVAQETEGDIKKENKAHVFQALQYMRKLCNHPALVMNEKHPKYQTTVKDLAKQQQTLKDVQHAPKLLALRDLLLDCGIGSHREDSSGGVGTASDLGASVVNQHRALIFCQIRDMLDMVENDVLKKLLPSVSYMRLDGTTDPRNRQSIVQEFNADPSIDVLLLTTHVGGLGLNLTGADTVIFVEHDWNPMKDLQAMDRAHRIGQKKTVNVYRLITRGTLEEKIMGLQKFKINIASTIVNQQNSGLATMETDQILDLFNVGDAQTSAKTKNEGGIDAQGNIIKKGQKSVFDDLDTLHDEKEYAEFDVDAFVRTL